MTYQVELTEKEITGFIDFLSGQVNDNLKVITQLTEENEGIKDRIEKLRKDLFSKAKSSKNIAEFSDKDVVYPEGYNPDMLWFDKVKFILKKSPEGLTTSQIIEELIKIEPKYRSDRQTAVRSISGTVSAKSKPDGELVRVTNYRNEFVYSLKEANELAQQNIQDAEFQIVNTYTEVEELPF